MNTVKVWHGTRSWQLPCTAKVLAWVMHRPNTTWDGCTPTDGGLSEAM